MIEFPKVPEIEPVEVVRAIEAGEALQILDVRHPERVSQGRIDLVPGERFHNLRFSELRRLTDLAGTGLAPELPTVVVCGHGNDSRFATAHLLSLQPSLEARSMRGGMAAYMEVAVPRSLAPPASLDALVQLDRVGKGSLGYVLASDGEALIVDPARNASVWLEAARAANARVVAVADTHVHADYVSGAPALAASLGVPYYLHPADASYPYDGTPGRISIAPLADGARLRFGRASVIARHTPGHTEGSTTFLLDDDVALTGDFVFVDSIGRPDLAGKAAEWAVALWESLERARREWSDRLRVLPAHYASERERNADRSIGARFGELRRTNVALALTDRDAFLRWASAPATAPEAYRAIKAVNVGLLEVSELEAQELEVGRNECAIGGPAA